MSDLLEHALPGPKNKQIIGRALTPERRHEHAAVFDEVFDKAVGALQLDLMALQPLAELRTVQERVAELQRRQTHRARRGLEPNSDRRSAPLGGIQEREREKKTFSASSGKLVWKRLPAPFFHAFLAFSPPQLPDTLAQPSLTESSVRLGSSRLFTPNRPKTTRSRGPGGFWVPAEAQQSQKDEWLGGRAWLSAKAAANLCPRTALNGALLLWERETPAGAC